jgi:hypothetical protein
MRSVLEAVGDYALAMRMELSRDIQEIVITPGESTGEIKYKGKWDLLGDGNELRNRGCAEGQNRTGYAGLFRAALYQ